MSAQDVADLKAFIAGPVTDEIAARTNAQKDDLAKQLADSRGVILASIQNSQPAQLAADINAAGIASAVRDELVKILEGK